MARIIDAFTQFFDDSGNPLVNGWLKFNESGTNNTDKNTFADVGQTIANANPVQLDGAGRCPSVFGSGSYSVISFKDSIVTPGSPGEQVQQFDPVGGELDGTAFSDWNASTIYAIGDMVRGSDGLDYRSITNNNQNNNPTASASKWEELRLGRVWNTNVTYGVGDSAYGSDGRLYVSIVASNSGNNPVTSNVEWTTGSQVLADFYTDTGAANAYVVGVANTGIAYPAYVDGMVVKFIASAANTGASTVNVSGLGVKAIKNRAGDDCLAGDINTKSETVLRFDSANDWFVADAIPVRGSVGLPVSGQTIPNNVDTLINWGSVPFDCTNGAMSSTGVTIPAGFTRVRITALIGFVGNAVDRRSITLFKNGSAIDFAPHLRVGAFTNSNIRMPVNSGWLDVTSGDVINVAVTQTSGGNLDTEFGNDKAFMVAELR